MSTATLPPSLQWPLDAFQRGAITHGQAKRLSGADKKYSARDNKNPGGEIL
jgi:hypothetical protein